MWTCLPLGNKGNFNSYKEFFGPSSKRYNFTNLSKFIYGLIVGIYDARRTYLGLFSPPFIIESKTYLHLFYFIKV